LVIETKGREDLDAAHEYRAAWGAALLGSRAEVKENTSARPGSLPPTLLVNQGQRIIEGELSERVEVAK